MQCPWAPGGKVICLIHLTEIKTINYELLERQNQSEIKYRIWICLDMLLCCSVLLPYFEWLFLSAVCLLKYVFFWIVNCVLIVSCSLKQKINDAVCVVYLFRACTRMCVVLYEFFDLVSPQHARLHIDSIFNRFPMWLKGWAFLCVSMRMHLYICVCAECAS